MKEKLILLLLFIMPLSCAVQVGVVVEFPNHATYMECVDVERGADAYEVLGKTELAITWTEHPVYGHGLCSIFEFGCKNSGCACTMRYWNFYEKSAGGKWRYSNVGFDAGNSCDEHYCARQGDVLGFTFNSDGKTPEDIGFEEICPKTEKEAPGITGRFIANPGRYSGFVAAGILLLLLAGYFMHKPWEYI